jgi:hypothetical protein
VRHAVCCLAMRLLPFEKIDMESPLPPGELSRRLAAIVDEPRLLPHFWGHKGNPLEGHVDGTAFKVWPFARFGRDSQFTLIAIGGIQARGSGAAIRALLRPHGFLLVLAAAWVVISLGASVWLLATEGAFPAAVALAFAVAGYLSVMLPFGFAVKRIAKALASVVTV